MYIKWLRYSIHKCMYEHLNSVQYIHTTLSYCFPIKQFHIHAWRHCYRGCLVKVLVAWVHFLVTSIWFHGCTVSGCLQSLPGSIHMPQWLPGKVSWLPEFGSWITFIASMVPWWSCWLTGFTSRFHGCLVKVSGCLNSLPGSLDLVPWLPQGSWLPEFTFWFSVLGSLVPWWWFLAAWIWLLAPWTWFHGCLVAGLGSMVAWWRLPDSMIHFVVLWTWFHHCLVKAIRCLQAHFLVPWTWLPGFGSWLPGFGSWFPWLGSVGCHGGGSLVPYCCIWLPGVGP